jgi:UPF0755 protein
MDSFNSIPEKLRPHTAVSVFTLFIAGICGLLALLYILTAYANKPHTQFPVETDIVIEEGLTIRDITEVLENAHVVRSSFYAYLVLVDNYKEDFIQAGTYRFSEPYTTHEVARSITSGLDMSPHVSITLPEGFRARDIYRYLPESFSASDSDIEQYEGFLFPDTYFISQGMDINDVSAILLTTFEKKIAPYTERINASGFSQREVIILASLLEREAKDNESKRIVSGILQKRLAIGMPLQVDATFDYVLGKSSDELTEEDLEMDSPFNTYLYPGLPPAPIANPGLESIEAVLEPAATEYLYYLTASDGTFHYAQTFEEHKRNKELYLK